MIDLKKYKQLKTDVQEAQREADRAEGSLEAVKKELKSSFNVDNLSEAKKLLARLENDKSNAEKKYDTELKKFEEKWKDELQ